jgi:hypothetical protein
VRPPVCVDPGVTCEKHSTPQSGRDAVDKRGRERVVESKKASGVGAALDVTNKRRRDSVESKKGSGTGGAGSEKLEDSAGAGVEDRVERSNEERGKGGNERSRWTFEKAYNVVEVEGVRSEPFQLLVKARPPVAGNKAPQKFWMETSDVQGIDNLGGKQAKRLKANLVKCLEAYFAETDEDSSTLVNVVVQTQWAAELVKTLRHKRVASGRE